MKSFFQNNLQSVITEERSITPDTKFTILNLGLKNYYETFKPFNEVSGFFYFEQPNKENLSFSINHDYITSSYSSIVFLQLFFEHYINEILYNIKPFLLYGKLNKEIDLIYALTNDWDSIPQNNDRTIDFRMQLTRLELLIKHEENINLEFKVPCKYHFLVKHKEALIELLEQRNEIVHRGNKILAKYAYELLMSNFIIPIIGDLLTNEINNDNLNTTRRKNYCDIDVIQEILTIKLPEKHYTNIEETEYKLKRLNHLKELGRATLKNPIDPIPFNEIIEKNHNKPLREFAIKDALARLEKDKANEIHICPCCGTKSLLTFNLWYWYPPKNFFRIEKAKCFACTYSINASIGEPSDFGIKCEMLFKTYVASNE